MPRHPDFTQHCQIYLPPDLVHILRVYARLSETDLGFAIASFLNRIALLKAIRELATTLEDIEESHYTESDELGIQ